MSSNKKQESAENKKDKDTEQDDSFRISIEEDVTVHIESVQPSSNKDKNTDNSNSKRKKKDKDATQDKIDELQQVSGSSNMNNHVKDDSKSKDGSRRRKGRTVIYVYLCPRFTCNLFSRAPPVPPRSQNQRRRFGFADGSYTVFTVETAKSKGEPVDYDEFDTEEDEEDRNVFVRKVFSICSVMLVVTVSLTVMSYLTPVIRRFMATMEALALVGCSFLGSLSVQYTYCCSNCSRIFPINYSLNIFATLCFSYITSFMSARYEPLVVISTASVTLVASLVCLGLAYTSFDFTRFILPFTIALLSFLAGTLICATLVFVFSFKLDLHRMIILVFSAMCSSTMLVIESQMILGGKSVEIGEDDFTFGAYMAYNSIVNIFLKVLGVINFATGSDD